VSRRVDRQDSDFALSLRRLLLRQLRVQLLDLLGQPVDVLVVRRAAIDAAWLPTAPICALEAVDRVHLALAAGQDRLQDRLAGHRAVVEDLRPVRVPSGPSFFAPSGRRGTCLSFAFIAVRPALMSAAVTGATCPRWWCRPSSSSVPLIVCPVICDRSPVAVNTPFASPAPPGRGCSATSTAPTGPSFDDGPCSSPFRAQLLLEGLRCRLRHVLGGLRGVLRAVLRALRQTGARVVAVAGVQLRRRVRLVERGDGRPRRPSPCRAPRTSPAGRRTVMPATKPDAAFAPFGTCWLYVTAASPWFQTAVTVM
jgi:hypothetical protein